jgi:RNA polymerase sigma-70 factor (ECF subfamily)
MPSAASALCSAAVSEPQVQRMAAGDEDTLLRAAGRGDPDACGELYRRFAGVIHGIALAHVGVQEAEDVVQEAFVSIYGGIGSVRGGAALAAWVCTVARNAAIDHLRRRRRRPVHEPLGEIPSNGLDAAGEESRAALVLAQLQRLPVAYRETLALRFVEGLTGPEIASRTGMTHGSVRVNLCRGMALLRPLLEKEGLL